jgi:signal transduction histidine kinase/CheY-like chemotaxis protein
MKTPWTRQGFKLSYAPNLIAALIMGAGLLAAFSYLSREASRTELVAVKDLENEGAARYNRILNELERRKAALTTLGGFFSAMDQVNEKEFRIFTRSILSLYGLQSVCWTSSDGKTFFVNSEVEEAGCQHFDMLAPNKIIKQENEFGILLSSFTRTQARQEGFVSIYLELRTLIPTQRATAFAEELVVSDAHTDEFALYPFTHIPEALHAPQRKAAWERFYKVEEFDGILVLYSARLYPLRRLSHLSLLQIMPALFLCGISTILGLFVRVLFLQKNRIAEQVAQQTRHLQQSNQLLEEARDKAESADRAKSTFLANMSHEIRTPLNGVLGMASLLLESPLTDEQRSYVQAIHRSGDTLVTVINDILDLSKIEAGRLDFESINFSLEQAVQDVRLSLSLAAQQKNLEFITEIAPDTPRHLLGDPSRLRQVLTNLISNAIKFTSSGSVRLLISSLSAVDGSAQLRFEVHDTGIGMTQDTMKKLFTPFTQADNSTTRRFGGTGLGLSICKYLVEKMNGEIGVESEVGKGSVFWFTLVLPVAAEMRPYLTTVPAETLRVPLTGVRVLVVDDVGINQTIVKALLEKFDCSVNTAANGREALHLLQARPYDLVFMDCQMPEMDGYEATRLIRGTLPAPLSQVPVIAMTAHAMKGDAEKCLEAGMSDYMSKPIRLMELEAILRKWQPRQVHSA